MLCDKVFGRSALIVSYMWEVISFLVHTSRERVIDDLLSMTCQELLRR